MRRFIAYLLASLTIFLGIGVAFKPVATSINADLDYREGRQITFQLTNNDEDNSQIEDEGKTVKEYAAVMETRLTNYGISDYQIITSGVDMVKVTLTTNNTDDCTRIAKLLTTNPEIEISNLPKEGTEGSEAVEEHHVTDDPDGKYSWHDNKAYLTYNGAATILVMPIPTDAKKAVEEMIEAAKKYEGGGEEEEESNDEEEGEEEEVKQSIVLWMDRSEDDFYADKSNPNVAKKIIFDQFNSSNFYYGENQDAFQIIFNPTDTDIKNISAAYNEANLMLNLLNASETNVTCVDIETKIIPASVENLLVYGSRVSIAMSATFISLLVAFIIISLLLIFFYRLSVIAIISTATLSTFLTFLIFVLFKSTFNIATLVGLIVVALSSLASAIVHNHYVHEEVYKGRNLKKANYEASKKTTLLTADISIISILTGIILYFLGGGAIASAGIVLVISSVVNIIINTFLLKGMMWLLTNNTSFQDKNCYKLLNIDMKKVPDLSKEEKQTYYGPFINKDYSKKKKVGGLITLTLTLASVIGIIAFGANNKLFNTSNYYSSSNEATFSIVAANSSQPHPSIQDINVRLDTIKCDGKTFKYDANNIEFYQYEVVNDDKSKSDPNITYYQTYRIKILESDIASSIYYINDDIENKMILEDALREALSEYISLESEHPLAAPRVYTNTLYNVPNNALIVLASIILSVFIVSIYLLIRRFRASRVLTMFIASNVSSIVAIGFISLTRLVATPIMSATALLTSIVTLIICLIIMHKDKDMIKEERLRDLATRKTILIKANAMALTPTLIFALISIYSAINSFGFGNKAYIALFLSASIALIVNVIFIVTCFVSLSNFFDERFSRIKLPEIKRTRKNKIKVKSNEPQEAVFIGIND